MIKSDDTGKLILRLTLGILILLHGLFKITGGGVGGIGGMLSSHGLPGFLAYGVYIGEILAPVLLIVGIANNSEVIKEALDSRRARKAAKVEIALAASGTGTGRVGI